MSDLVNPAADFITKFVGHSWRWEAAQLAQAMGAAGLLADPTTSRTDAEQAVIESTEEFTPHEFVGVPADEWDRISAVVEGARRVKTEWNAHPDDDGFYDALADLCAAVGRLAATEEATP